MILIASIPDKIQWHPGFCGAIELEFHTDSSSLLYVPELSLGKKPLSADLLILKKTAEFPLENETGKLFKSYNIIEYKSPDDSLTIDDFFKVSAYACLYKSSGNTVNKYPEQEITVSIFRDAFPRNLFSMLKNSVTVHTFTVPRGDFCAKCTEIPRSVARNAAEAAFLCIAKRCYVHDPQGSEQ